MFHFIHRSIQNCFRATLQLWTDALLAHLQLCSVAIKSNQMAMFPILYLQAVSNECPNPTAQAALSALVHKPSLNLQHDGV